MSHLHPRQGITELTKKHLSSAGTILCLTGLAWLAQPAANSDAAPSRQGRPVVAAAKARGAPARPALGHSIDAASSGLDTSVLQLALTAVNCAVRLGDISAPHTLTVIDYSRPSVDRRLWVFDLGSGKLLFHELVAHGRNTGENLATRFSDEMNSRQSSIGLFTTADTYVGSNGYSLRLDGLEKGFNARARARAIVMHGAPYVDVKLAAAQGRLGRSWGCPALREGVARHVIDRISGGGAIFSYYPDQNWLKNSRFLSGCGGANLTA